jgi:hypothetical protein
MQAERKIKIQNTARNIFIALFLLILIAPFLDERFKIYALKDNIEKRALADKIPFSFTKRFTKSYENYYNDNFGFRMLLIDWGGIYKTSLFHASSKPEKTLFGKNGWLFYNDTADAIIKSYPHKNLLSESQLEWKVRSWEAMKDSCNKAGIQYIKVFWPDKQTIYPEFLPFSMKIQIKDTLSLADQIIAYIKEKRSPLTFIDVRRALREGKKDHQLYQKLDSHWNSYGAFLAYSSFFQQTQSTLGVVPKELNAFNITWQVTHEGDLADMLGLQTQTLLSDFIPVFTYKNTGEQYRELPLDGYPDGLYITRNEKCNNHFKVIMFRDSYSMALEQFFSLSFYEIIYVWNGYNPGLVKELKPDIVIDAAVERYL